VKTPHSGSPGIEGVVSTPGSFPGRAWKRMTAAAPSKTSGGQAAKDQADEIAIITQSFRQKVKDLVLGIRADNWTTSARQHLLHAGEPVRRIW